jgi:hypothetical protein
MRPAIAGRAESAACRTIINQEMVSWTLLIAKRAGYQKREPSELGCSLFQ